MAIITVNPGSPTAIQDAVNAAQPGDVIVVENGTYHEEVTISAGKDNIRIVARHIQGAILDGENTRFAGFSLTGVSGVEIFGFRIENYIDRGIIITSGANANRIVCNKIENIGITAILFAGVNGLLIWGNEIVRSGTGIGFQGASSTWIIENKIHNNFLNGISGFESNQGIAFIANTIFENNGSGILVENSSNSLALYNIIFKNGLNGVNFAKNSDNSLAIQNKISNNINFGTTIDKPADNVFLGNNKIINNTQTGVNVLSNFNIIQGNDIEKNNNNGLLIGSQSTGNFIFRNEFNNNEPQNIKDLGVDNNFLQNQFKDNDKC
jgi:hypothetical protein